MGVLSLHRCIYLPVSAGFCKVLVGTEPCLLALCQTVGQGLDGPRPMWPTGFP